jgi:hypothetical protein
MDGSRVCYVHGAGSPQARRAADVRVALAEQLINGPRRQLWEVLLDSIHVSDVVARRELEELLLSPETTPEQLERLLAANERRARLSRSGIDAGLAQRRQAFHEAQGKEIAGLVERVMRELGLTAEQRRALPAVLAREVRVLLGAVDAEVVDGG